MKSLLIAFLANLLIVAVNTAPMTKAEKIEMLLLHNQARASVTDASDMTELVWDNDLERDAQEYANTCPSDHADQEGQGENIAWGWPTSSVADAMNGWVLEERSFFQYGLPRWCKGGFPKCGHYSQIIWANSTRLGCAKKSGCENMVPNTNPGDVYICRFKEPGNFFGRQPYSRGQTCSACPPRFPNCISGLCSARTGIDVPTFIDGSNQIEQSFALVVSSYVVYLFVGKVY